MEQMEPLKLPKLQMQTMLRPHREVRYHLANPRRYRQGPWDHFALGPLAQVPQLSLPDQLQRARLVRFSFFSGDRTTDPYAALAERQIRHVNLASGQSGHIRIRNYASGKARSEDDGGRRRLCVDGRPNTW